jgi:hypothetical protein
VNNVTLLDEIIEDAVNENTQLTALLRKCLILAHKLRNEKLKAWAENELNGYSDFEALPEYRKISISAVGSFSGPFGNALNDQPLQASALPKEYRHWAQSANLMQPLIAYDIGKDANGLPHDGYFPWPSELVARFASKFITGWMLIRAKQVVPGTVFRSILDSVRTRIVQFSLELKDELGEETENLNKISAIEIEKSVVNHIYGGQVVIAANAQNFAQISSISVQKGDFSELKDALHKIGFDQKAITSLQNAINEDARADNGKPTLGHRTMGWIGDAASYASKEGLRVGFDVAKRYATKWLLQHYGLDIG